VSVQHEGQFDPVGLKGPVAEHPLTDANDRSNVHDAEVDEGRACDLLRCRRGRSEPGMQTSEERPAGRRKMIALCL
jgi:hypothetical protein